MSNLNVIRKLQISLNRAAKISILVHFLNYGLLRLYLAVYKRDIQISHMSIFIFIYKYLYQVSLLLGVHGSVLVTCGSCIQHHVQLLAPNYHFGISRISPQQLYKKTMFHDSIKYKITFRQRQKIQINTCLEIECLYQVVKLIMISKFVWPSP